MRSRQAGRRKERPGCTGSVGWVAALVSDSGTPAGSPHPWDMPALGPQHEGLDAPASRGSQGRAPTPVGRGPRALRSSCLMAAPAPASVLINLGNRLTPTHTSRPHTGSLLPLPALAGVRDFRRPVAAAPSPAPGLEVGCGESVRPAHETGGEVGCPVSVSSSRKSEACLS